MNLRQIEVFRAVMLTGGVNAAAELLHVSQPAVSKVLAHAARASGLVLFERIKGRLVPTPEARLLYAEVEGVWRGVEKLRDVSHELAHPRGGTLRLATTASLAPSLVPGTIARLYETLPALKCRMEVLVPRLLAEALLDRSAHLGIALMPLEHPSIAAVRHYKCGLACVLPPGHALAARKQIEPKDLIGHRLISSPTDTPYGQLLARAYGPLQARLRTDIEVRSATTACWFVRAGAGLAVVDAAAAAGSAAEGLPVRPFKSAETLEVSILHNRQLALSTVEKAFVEVFDEVWKAMIQV